MVQKWAKMIQKMAQNDPNMAQLGEAPKISKTKMENQKIGATKPHVPHNKEENARKMTQI